MMRRPLRLWFLVLASLAIGQPAQAGFNTYIALGDSLAFGEYRFEGTSNGDRGYVAPYADKLGILYGVRPNVVNLGVDGETSSTFVNGSAPGDGSAGSPGYFLNTHYTAPYAMSQNEMLLSTIAAQTAAGNQITNVTVQLGANDLFVLAANPTFAGGTPAEQYALLTTTISTLAANDAQIITELKSLIPGVSITMIGYYNPYAPFINADPSNPLSYYAQVSAVAIPAVNQAISGVASAFGVQFVDPFSTFVGHELEYTDVANQGNVHPNAEGYAALGRIINAVPEPSSVISMALGGLGLVGYGIRHRRRVIATGLSQV